MRYHASEQSSGSRARVSYSSLIALEIDPPSRIKRLGEEFFCERDVSEVVTFVEMIGSCENVPIGRAGCGRDQ